MTGQTSGPELEAFTGQSSGTARRPAWAPVGSRPPRALAMGASVDAGDEELIARIVARDSRAIADLYDRYSRLLFSVAYRILQNHGDAEEVLQGVFLAVWTRVSTYSQAKGSPAAWLVRITRNRAIDRLRAHRAHRRVAKYVEVPEPALTPETAAQRTEARRMVADALRTLSGEQRELIQTAYFEGLSQSELAARFQLPLGTVKTRIRTGMKILREALERVRSQVPRVAGPFETAASLDPMVVARRPPNRPELRARALAARMSPDRTSELPRVRGHQPPSSTSSTSFPAGVDDEPLDTTPSDRARCSTLHSVPARGRLHRRLVAAPARRPSRLPPADRVPAESRGERDGEGRQHEQDGAHRRLEDDLERLALR